MAQPPSTKSCNQFAVAVIKERGILVDHFRLLPRWSFRTLRFLISAGWDGVKIVFPDRDVGVLADLYASDFVFEKQLPCSPCGIRTQGRVDIGLSFLRSKRMSVPYKPFRVSRSSDAQIP